MLSLNPAAGHPARQRVSDAFGKGEAGKLAIVLGSSLQHQDGNRHDPRTFDDGVPITRDNH